MKQSDKCSGDWLAKRMSSEDESEEALFKAVGARVREIRTRLGISQRDFATAAGLSPGYAWRVEDGRQNLNLRTLARIALALNTEMSELLTDVPASLVSPSNRPYRRGENPS